MYLLDMNTSMLIIVQYYVFINIGKIDVIVQYAISHDISLVVVGPEQPLGKTLYYNTLKQ